MEESHVGTWMGEPALHSDWPDYFSSAKPMQFILSNMSVLPYR